MHVITEKTGSLIATLRDGSAPCSPGWPGRDGRTRFSEEACPADRGGLASSSDDVLDIAVYLG